MTIIQFEDIIAWQKAQNLAVDIYKGFIQNNDWGFLDQIYKAVVSISNNIAEGFDRNTDPEFKRFLYIAKSSCSEVRSMLYLAVKLGYLESERSRALILYTEEISKLISGLIRSIK